MNPLENQNQADSNITVTNNLELEEEGESESLSLVDSPNAEISNLTTPQLIPEASVNPLENQNQAESNITVTNNLELEEEGESESSSLVDSPNEEISNFTTPQLIPEASVNLLENQNQAESNITVTNNLELEEEGESESLSLVDFLTEEISNFTTPAIDKLVLKYLKEQAAGGDENIFKEIINSYLEEAPQKREAIIAAIVAKDPIELRNSAHALKSLSLTIGANNLAQLSGELEAIGRMGTTENAEELMELINQEYHRVKIVLKSKI